MCPFGPPSFGSSSDTAVARESAFSTLVAEALPALALASSSHQIGPPGTCGVRSYPSEAAPVVQIIRFGRRGAAWGLEGPPLLPGYPNEGRDIQKSKSTEEDVTGIHFLSPPDYLVLSWELWSIFHHSCFLHGDGITVTQERDWGRAGFASGQGAVARASTQLDGRTSLSRPVCISRDGRSRPTQSTSEYRGNHGTSTFSARLGASFHRQVRNSELSAQREDASTIGRSLVPPWLLHQLMIAC